MSTLARDTNQRETALFLEAVPVFSELPEEHLQFLSGMCGKVHLPAGEVLFEEGDPGDAVFVIKRGVLEVFTHLPNGEELVLARLSSHELIGEHYILDGSSGRRSACVRAVSPSELIRISHESFDRLLKRNPMVAEHLAARRVMREQDNLARRSELFRVIRETPVDTPAVSNTFQVGEVVFREGDAADAVYLIVSGSVVAYREARPDVPLGELGVGQCFGERAVVSDQVRTASVRASTPLEVLVVPRANFMSLHEQSPELQAVVAGLEFNYRLPSRGVALQFTARRENEESIERFYRLPDRRQFLSSYMVRRRVFRLERVGVPRGPHIVEYSWRDSDGRYERVLRIGPLGEILGVVANGNWEVLPQLIEATLDASPLPPDALEAFSQTGELPASALAQDASDVGIQDEEVLCLCLNIKARRLRDLIAAGYANFDSLRKTTGCGSVCGGCESRICDLIDPPEWAPVAATSKVLTSQLRAFVLKSAQIDPYPEWAPGQHLLLEGRIRGAWVSRAYLITSPPVAGVPEIIVRCEPRGVFTRWLFDGPVEEKQLRISPPRGVRVDLAQSRPIVCVAHEVGASLALAIIRSAASAGVMRRIHIELSAEHPAGIPHLEELKQAAIANANITVNCVFGPWKPRARRSLAQGLREGFREADFYLCSTAADTGILSEHLMRAGVAEERITEVLFNMGGLPAPAAKRSIWRRWGMPGVAVVAVIVFLLLFFSRSAGGW